MSLKRALIAVLVVALGFAVRSSRLTAFEQHESSQRYEDMYYLPPAEWLPVLSLGYNTAVADLLWCASLVYFGSELVHRGAVKHLFEYTDAILALDPDFKQPYRWAAVGSLYRAGELSVDDALKGASYLRRAVKRWPNDGQLAWDFGSVLRFEISPRLDKADPLRATLMAEAADHLSTAATLGAGPAWLALNSSNLLLKLGRTEQAIRHLEEVYGTVEDERTKEAIASQLAKLRSQSYAEAIREANSQFERERVASFPYMSAPLFFVIGPKIDAGGRRELLMNNFLPPDLGQVVDDAGDAPAAN